MRIPARAQPWSCSLERCQGDAPRRGKARPWVSNRRCLRCLPLSLWHQPFARLARALLLAATLFQTAQRFEFSCSLSPCDAQLSILLSPYCLFPGFDAGLDTFLPCDSPCPLRLSRLIHPSTSETNFRHCVHNVFSLPRGSLTR